MRSIFSEFKDVVFSSKKYVYFIFAGLVSIYIFSGIYFISQNEIGVLQFLGKIVDSKVSQGIHYTLPWPFVKITRVPVKTINRIVVDDFTQSKDNAFFKKTGLPAYCITGDNNIVNINCIIQYSISDPVQYLLSITDNKETLHKISGNVIIKCLARLSVDEILTFGKIKMGNYIKKELQDRIDEIKGGLDISFVELKEVKPPEQVQKYFDDVINAKIDKEKTINDAEIERNNLIPMARGRANNAVEEAEAYKTGVVLYAEGDAKRFLDICVDDKKELSLIKKRLYLELIKELFPNIENKYFISKDDKKAIDKIKILIGK